MPRHPRSETGTRIESAISNWTGRQKSLAYFGPSNDASPLWFLSQKKKYNHFIYIDASPHDTSKPSERRMFWNGFETFMAAMGIRVDKIQRHPAEKRVIFFLTVIGHPPQALPEDLRNTSSAPKRLILEYFTRQFQMIQTKTGLKSQTLLLSKLATVVGLENRGAVLPKVSIRRIMPKLKEVFNAYGIHPREYNRNFLRTTVPSSRFLRKLVTPDHFRNDHALLYNRGSSIPPYPRAPLVDWSDPRFPPVYATTATRTWESVYDNFGPLYMHYDI